MNYYEHHLGDYMRDTAHLSLLEDGAYRRLLDAYYVREKPLPADLRECCKLARATSKAEREAVAYVLREFFSLTEQGHQQKRADDEIDRFRGKSAKARSSVQQRWERTRSVPPGVQQTNYERNTNVSPDGYERNTNDIHRAPVPSPQSPDIYVETNVSTPRAVSPRSAEPPTPPPPFDGTNAETLNGRAIVTLAIAWELPDEWGLDAEKLGFKPPEVLREAERFRQYFVAGKGAGTRRSVKGWRQSWSNWLGKAAGDNRR